ncbi:MAG: hypothetical protein IIW38_02355 [Alistipes sp.]|jgi:hypothetical protein|nr:hypothetical protein [Alistipes sp.]MBQ5836421.1 hypothetical protein [Alistipes sp.]
MAPNAKKRLVVSFNNLPAELQEALKAAHPAGFADVMMRIPKPNGEFFFAVPFETEEISYLVKIDVKIDDTDPDDDDKDIFGDEDDISGADELSGNDAVEEISDGSADFDM